MNVFLRFTLLGAVIAGILAMHTLSAAGSGSDHGSMATTSAGAGSPGMSGMPMDWSVVPVGPVPPGRPAIAGIQTRAGTGSEAGAAAGTGMSPMSCCVLFFVSAAGLLLLMRSSGSRTEAASGVDRCRWPFSASGQRGPPAAGRPRISLSIQRV